MKTSIIKKTTVGLILFFLAFQSVFAQQSCLIDDFSTVGPWKHEGQISGAPTSTVSVTNGTIYFNYTIGGTEDRVWRSADLFSTWRADFDFKPTQQSDPGHIIFSYTSTSSDPWYAGIKGVTSNQNSCGVGYGNFNTGGNPTLYISAKLGDGTTFSAQSTGITAASPLSTTYYIRLERINRTTLRLSVFSNSARTTSIAGSPVTLTIPCNLNGLQFIQSANGWGSGTQRSLTATIDNLSICPLP